MPHLVAVDLPGGPAFVDTLRREWDAGNAVLPIDRRLPPTARAALMHAMAPDRLVDADGTHHLDGRGVDEGDALVVATSGSTGVPKGVVLTHAAVAASAWATSKHLGIHRGDAWLACLPLAHVGGLSVVTRAIITDTPLVVQDGFDTAAVEQAARDGATAVALVATALRRIDPAQFRVILLGGARPPADRPAHAVTTYGMTETGSGVVYDGRPLADVDVRIEPDGEILLRCPMLLRCYRDGSTPLDRDGWLHTGDLGHWLPDGRLHVEGRRGDLIITGGENVWPDAVEAALADAQGVAEVAVAGVDDPEWGQRVVAWVVPADPARPPTLPQLRTTVAERLPTFCAPKELRLVSDLPRTALGKVQRHVLQASREHTGGAH